MLYKYLLILVPGFFCLDSCKPRPFIELEGYAQGTTYHISYEEKSGISYQSEIDSIFLSIDKSLSTYDSTSIISRINSNDASIKIDKYFFEMFRRSDVVYKNTKGAFDPTVGGLVDAWGFGFKNGLMPDSTEVERLLKFVGFSHVQLVNICLKNVSAENDSVFTENCWVVEKEFPETKLDFNSIAQGYTVDLISEFLEGKGIENYLAEVGGELRSKGRNEHGDLWEAGIDDPVFPPEHREVKAKVILKNKSVSTSGSYRNFYVRDHKRYSHIIDPKTGYPVQNSLLSVSVFADNCSTTDAYDTPFMILGLKESLEIMKGIPGLEAYFIFYDDSGKVETYSTNGLKKILREK